VRPVQQCTWNWREESAVASGENLSRASLLRQALLQSAVMSVVGLFLYFFLGHHIAGMVVIGLAVIVMLLGIILPPAYAKVHAFGQLLGQFVGRILLYVLMVPFFFLFMTPAALILRMQKRDPLQRDFRDPQWTYWIPRAPRPRDDNIEKQFLRESKAARTSLRPVGSIGWKNEGDA
jgi:hypothetical protein